MKIKQYMGRKDIVKKVQLFLKITVYSFSLIFIIIPLYIMLKGYYDYQYDNSILDKLNKSLTVEEAKTLQFDHKIDEAEQRNDALMLYFRDKSFYNKGDFEDYFQELLKHLKIDSIRVSDDMTYTDGSEDDDENQDGSPDKTKIIPINNLTYHQRSYVLEGNGRDIIKFLGLIDEKFKYIEIENEHLNFLNNENDVTVTALIGYYAGEDMKKDTVFQKEKTDNLLKTFDFNVFSNKLEYIKPKIKSSYRRRKTVSKVKKVVAKFILKGIITQDGASTAIISYQGNTYVIKDRGVIKGHQIRILSNKIIIDSKKTLYIKK